MAIQGNMHRCPSAGCDKRVSNEKLMCYAHWKELSWAEQRAVWDSFDKTGGGPEHLRNIAPILERQKERLMPPRNQGKPFGL